MKQSVNPVVALVVIIVVVAVIAVAYFQLTKSRSNYMAAEVMGGKMKGGKGQMTMPMGGGMKGKMGGGGGAPAGGGP